MSGFPPPPVGNLPRQADWPPAFAPPSATRWRIPRRPKGWCAGKSPGSSVPEPSRTRGCSIRARAISWRRSVPASRSAWRGSSYRRDVSLPQEFPPRGWPISSLESPLRMSPLGGDGPASRVLERAHDGDAASGGWAFAQAAAEDTLAKHFGTRTLEGFGFSESPADKAAVRAAGAVLDYLSETQKSSLEHIDSLLPYRSGQILEIDEASRRSLEISRTIRDGRREGSLLAVLDRCVTAMGSRLLADWVANPLTDREAIEARLDAVEEFAAGADLTEDLRQALKQVYDVERLLARVATGRATPRDLAFLGRTLACLPAIKRRLGGCQSGLLCELENRIELCEGLRERIEKSLADECPITSREGGFIRDGFHEELDSLRQLQRGGKQWIARYQAEEMERTGIPNLKVDSTRSSVTTWRSRTSTGRRCPTATSASRRSRMRSVTSLPS